MILGDPSLPRDISAYPRLISRLYDLFRKIDREFQALSYRGETTVDPANVAPGATTTFTITVLGGLIGDSVRIFPPYSLQGLVMSASVTATDTATVVLYNPTGGAIDLGSGLWKAKAEKY